MNTIDNIKNHIDSLNGKFFTVKFIKKDGTNRIMTARTGVKKYLKGGNSHNTNPNHIIVYDVQNKGYRTIDLSKVYEMHTQKNKYQFF